MLNLRFIRLLIQDHQMPGYINMALTNRFPPGPAVYRVGEEYGLLKWVEDPGIVGDPNSFEFWICGSLRRVIK